MSIAQVSEKWEQYFAEEREAFIVFLKHMLLMAIIIFAGRSELYNVGTVKNPMQTQE